VLKEASALPDTTLNEFMVQTSLERAKKILERDQIVSLTTADTFIT
jgi:uncharacterized protein (DUF1778 family)